MSFLELKNVSKGFGSSLVLKDVNLSISEGEFVAIVGFSGAGKTTLLSLLAGLLKPDGGSVQFDGKEVTGPGPDRGIVFQNYSLLPWLTVFENVKLAVDQVFPEKSAAERVAHTDQFVTMVKLGPARDKRPGDWRGRSGSAGERRVKAGRSSGPSNSGTASNGFCAFRANAKPSGVTWPKRSASPRCLRVKAPNRNSPWCAMRRSEPTPCSWAMGSTMPPL